MKIKAILTAGMAAIAISAIAAHPMNPDMPEKRDDRAVKRLKAFLEEGESALAERLIMYWESHSTDVFVRDQAVVAVGGRRAPAPTVAFSGNRSHVTAFKRPSVENLPRKSEDERGMLLEPKAGGSEQWVKYGQTGCMIESINCEIIGLAKNAAYEYARTGDERFARQAWEVLDTYLAGIYYRNVPTDLAHGHMQTLFGMQSMETIHDSATIKNLVSLYDYMYSWAEKNRPERLPLLQDALRKWAQVQIDNGVADNNWDMMQLNNILDIAIVLESDSAYRDGRGREHFIDVVMNQSSVRNLSVTALAQKGFDPETGIWFECPGYSQVVLSDYADFADKVKRLLDIDLFEKIPVLKKAFPADGEYLFPDKMIIGFGDTHPAPIKENIAKHGPLHSSPFFYAPNASWLVSRSGMNAQKDIAFALNGALGNHMHANGISLELYAKGYRLGPDAGIGWSLYSGEDYAEYYSRWPAHNTVMVNSRSNHEVMKVFQPFEMVQHGEEWASVKFREPATGAEQLRTVSRVGRDYFVECFRSRVGKEGEEEWHDYYYHNLGDKLTLNGDTEPTEEIAFVESGLYGLSYMQDKRERKGKGKLVAQFDWAKDDGNVDMTMFVNDADGRKFIQALAPATEGLSRCKDPDYGITRDSRTPCLIVRQRGEAWTKPFLVVFDPKHVTRKVEFGENSITVTRKDGRVETHEFTEDGLYVRTTDKSHSLKSPNGRLEAKVRCGSAEISFDGKKILTVKGFPAECEWAKAQESKIDHTWTNPFGERETVVDKANVLKLGPLEVRAYDEGIAWQAKSANYEFVFEDSDPVCWPVSHAQGEYKPYKLSALGQQAPMPGWAPVAAGFGKMFNYDQKYIVEGSCESPLVVEPKGCAVALGDAAVYGGARLRFKNSEKPGTVTAYLEGPGKNDEPSWKYVRVASTPAELYNGNDLLLNLSKGSEIKDESYIKPGKCMRLAKLDTQVGKELVDFILANKLDYLEIDCGWYGQEHTGDPMKPGLSPERVARGEKFDLFEIIEYANEKNVPVILYINRAPLLNNHVAILDAVKSWGVKGVKYGFLHVGSAEARAWAFELIKAAADRELLVDIHDEMRYTGEQRTYPNLMTVEGIRGNEEMPDSAHDAALVFTRYLTGPGDYTPCWTVNRVKNTLTHQLAMAAAYYSPWQFMFWYQKPSEVDVTDPALEFWREIPTVWKNTKALGGKIGEFAVVAREAKDGRWFVGALNGLKRRTIELDTSFLGDGEWVATLFTDKDPAIQIGLGDVAVEKRTVTAGSKIKLDAAARGGFAAIFEKKIEEPKQ